MTNNNRQVHKHITSTAIFRGMCEPDAPWFSLSTLPFPPVITAKPHLYPSLYILRPNQHYAQMQQKD